MEQLSDYDYFLPEELIAQEPLSDRTASRLLHLDKESGVVAHRSFRDAVDLLQPNDLLILNDTRVSALRLEGEKPSGGKVEALLLSGGPIEYVALLRPGRRLKPGAKILFGDLQAEVVSELEDGLKLIRFKSMKDLASRIQQIGSTPLPPYIRTVLQDGERYQTVYGQHPGSAAAPTAGLHFTSEILDALEAKGVKVGRVTLHVGIDTFRPVQVENLEEHRMHGERCIVPPETAEMISQCSGRIIAVGTTAVRTLESFAESSRKVRSGEMLSKLFIRPGYRFRVIDGMFTNFHLPQTTMLMMISALAGHKQVLSAYEAAVREGYRFLSFGDSMLII
jgi:S-adenosylmethionine:tRNA ribosyltransferase-isomerase